MAPSRKKVGGKVETNAMKESKDGHGNKRVSEKERESKAAGSGFLCPLVLARKLIQ